MHCVFFGSALGSKVMGDEWVGWCVFAVILRLWGGGSAGPLDVLEVRINTFYDFSQQVLLLVSPASFGGGEGIRHGCCHCQ